MLPQAMPGTQCHDAGDAQSGERRADMGIGQRRGNALQRLTNAAIVYDCRADQLLSRDLLMVVSGNGLQVASLRRTLLNPHQSRPSTGAMTMGGTAQRSAT